MDKLFIDKRDIFDFVQSQWKLHYSIELEKLTITLEFLLRRGILKSLAKKFEIYVILSKVIVSFSRSIA